MQSKLPTSSTPAGLALAAMIALGLAACGGGSQPPADQPAAAAESAATEPAAAETPVENPQAADLEAREKELQAKQVELELRERELAAQQAAAQAKPAPAPKPAATPKPAANAPAAAAAPPPPPPPVTIPSGTELSVQLASGYSTKTSVVGEAASGTLAADLVVDGRRVAKAGAPLRGTVTEVVSGSQKIGAVPSLKIEFTQLTLANGTTATINARVAQKGASEKGRDTAKILGGTAAGAVIGHQVSHDKGAVIGGVIGAAGGAIAAKKTGTELEIAAGSVVPATLRAPFEYRGP
jgi:hypothetical protein